MEPVLSESRIIAFCGCPSWGLIATSRPILLVTDIAPVPDMLTVPEGGRSWMPAIMGKAASLGSPSSSSVNIFPGSNRGQDFASIAEGTEGHYEARKPGSSSGSQYGTNCLPQLYNGARRANL